jgi:hypothetical protein
MARPGTQEPAKENSKMQRNDRRAAVAAKRATPDFPPLPETSPQTAQSAAAQWHERNDAEALARQVQHERHVSGRTRGAY